MTVNLEEIKPIRFNDPQASGQEVDIMVKKPNKTGMKLLLTVMIVAAGIGSGYALSILMPAKAGSLTTVTPPSADEIKVGAVYGSQDKAKFKDVVEGVLVKGGVDGEGSHHIMRMGGKSQNVYLTSSVLDLTLFENHKVEVAGETFASQKAGWLMDAGRIEVLELNAPKPFEEEPLEELPEE